MRPLIRLSRVAWLVVLTLAPGCSNALLFYETGKVALSLEARPNDASQPVQGSLAFKQRTAAIVPPLKSNGDAGAMISSFRFGKEPGFSGPITIQTGLVTGEAAKNAVAHGKTSQVAQAITGVEINSLKQNAMLCIKNADEKGALGELRTLAAIPWDSLTPAQRALLGDITGLGGRYGADMHAAIRAQLGL